MKPGEAIGPSRSRFYCRQAVMGIAHSRSSFPLSIFTARVCLAVGFTQCLARLRIYIIIWLIIMIVII